MFLRQLDLTTALRPSLYDDESLLFVQDGVGLYEGKFKIPKYQDGQAYLTSHRICYVDKVEPRKYSVAVELKDIDRTEFYAGFLKSSPKITLFPKANVRAARGIRAPTPAYANPADALVGSGSPSPRPTASPAPMRDLNATWICTICGLSNPVPSNFDASTANEYTPLPPCLACGIKPELSLMIRATIAAMSNRATGVHDVTSSTLRLNEGSTSLQRPSVARTPSHQSIICPRCTFHNHPSLSSCEMCGAPLQSPSDFAPPSSTDKSKRTGSPELGTGGESIVGNESIETIKLSFRAGIDKQFLDKLKGALVQRKWLLQSAPPVPRATATPPWNGGSSTPSNASSMPANQPHQRVVGIAGLEQRGAALRQNNQAVIGTAFEDLEALMTSAKEVIQMAEQFARQTNGGTDGDTEARRLISDSASALGLTTTKEMLGTGSAAEQLYITELSRNLAEYLTDDRKGVLRKEGGIVSLVDVWQMFNRMRNGHELVSPSDFEKAAQMWDSLNMPIRLRRFKSGLLVVQERSRTDAKTVSSILAWLREPQTVFDGTVIEETERRFGRGVTALETAEKFGWRVGVASEELELAEETGALCRDQCLDGTRFWENHFMEQHTITTT